MWHEKQEAICLPSQKMHTPKSLQGVSMENKILTPHSGTSESSRKRKLIAVNKQDTISASNHEYISPKEASLQHETGSLFGRNLGENSLELLSNQSPLSIESTIFRHRSDKGPFDGQNNLPETKKTCNEYFCKAGAEKISNASSSVLLQSFHHRGSLLSKTLDGGTLTASTWRPQTYDMFIENEEHKKMPVLKSCDELAGVAKFGPCLQDGMNSKSKIFPVRENQSLDLCSSSSEYLRPLGLLQHSPVKYDRLETDLGGKLCSFEASQDGTSCDLKKSGGQTSNSAGVNVNSIVGTGSLFACVEQNENDMSVQNELQFRSGPLGLGLSDNYKKENDRGHGGGNIQILKQVEGSDVENCKRSFLKETGPKNGDCPPTVDIRNDLSHGSFQSYKNSKSLVRKEAPTVAKKLWEGSLQLNSSVTVLAVAFFKSGQKMPNIKWSESIEVKGKVRFEAFEKYIQDLPRSRNRGLMVISLCWKEGSSESGLAGMKKVAKGYKDGERVGFAPLSPGMDLYICPRSETVITILAKHGFFKGMAAVEDNQDSLIGCVVWRRNQANSNTVVKKSEKMEQSVNSPPDASTRRVVEDNMSHAQPADESIPVASGTDCATLGSIKNDGIETKNVEPSNIQLELDKPSAIIKPLPTPSVPRNSLSVLVEIKTSFSNRASHEDSLGQSLEVEAPQMHNSGREKAKPSLELQRPVVSLPSDIINKVASLPDDDDLPEFDFGISPVISQTLTSNPLDAVITNKKLRAGGPWNMDGSLPTMEPTVQSLIFNQRRLENSNLAKLPVGAIQKKTPLENFVEYGKIFGFPILEEKHTAQNIAVSTRRSRTAFPFSKSRFGEDEDDMPEWQPPNVDLHKQSVPETNPLLPSPSLVAIHPPFSAQAFPRAYNCHNTVTTRSTQPRPTNGYMPRGPRSFTRLNSETLLRPTSNTFDVKFPVHPASWRGWRS